MNNNDPHKFKVGDKTVLVYREPRRAVWNYGGKDTCYYERDLAYRLEPIDYVRTRNDVPPVGMVPAECLVVHLWQQQPEKWIRLWEEIDEESNARSN